MTKLLEWTDASASNPRNSLNSKATAIEVAVSETKASFEQSTSGVFKDGAMSARRSTIAPALFLVVPFSLFAWLLWESGSFHRAEASAASPSQSLSGLPAPTGESEALVGQSLAAHAPLDFKDVFVTPAGPKGLEYTDTIRALDGRQVAVTGYMVKNYGPDPSVFVFSDVPRIHNEREEGLADSLPPSLLHVVLEIRPGSAPAWRREKLTVYGTLELGARQELNGRISYLRLRCDHITDAVTGNSIEVRKPVVLQRDRMASSPTLDAAARINGAPPIFFNPRRNQNPTITTPPVTYPSTK